MKKKLLLGLLGLSAIIGLASCDKKEFTVTFESNSGSTVEAITVTEEGLIAKPTDPTKDGYTFGGWFLDANFTQKVDFTTYKVDGDITLYALWIKNEVPPTTYTVTFNTNGGTEISTQTVSEDEWGSYTVQKPADPTREYKTFAGWFTDEACTTAFDFSSSIENDITLYAKWTSEYEMVTTNADYVAGYTTYGDGTKIAEDVTMGKFTYTSGLYFQNRNGKQPCVNTQKKDIYFTVSGRTNSLSWGILVDSGKKVNVGLYLIEGEERTEVKVWANVEGTNNDALVTIENLAAGTYVITTDQSVRFTSMSLTEELEKSAPSGLEIASMPQVDFLEGREFNSAGIAVYLTYENGRKDILEADAYTIDSSSYVKGTPGTYTITISNDKFSTSYDVVVYEAQSIEVADHVLDSKRITHPLETVFLVNDTFTSKYLAVTVTAKNITTNETKEFVLDAAEYTVSEHTLTSVGSQTVTVTAFETLTDTYKINVLNKVFNEESTEVMVLVNAELPVVATAQGVVFNKINDALRYLELCNIADETEKLINVAAGSYYEKVEIKLPNVRLVGSNTDTTETVVWYDRINGMVDPSGTTSYSTDGAASVSIRSTAVGFYAQDITFKNYYNTHELYLESLKISSSSQATAVLVQADQSFFKNVKFSSYHDTLYAQVGRQYYDNCYIEGRTDYIFGYNATAYFEDCTIHTIGAGTDEKNGGYVIATKGASNGQSDAVKYGYVFNNCTFEADENTQAGSVSLARGWDKFMTVMIMNSKISGAFSKEVYGNTESPLNDRYTKMNADPVASLLFEYNNTGDGALVVPTDDAATADVNEAEAFVAKYAEATCTVVTDATAAAPYMNLLEVFGAENGNVKWNETWGGNLEKNATIEFKTLDGTVLATVKSYVGAKLTKVQINKVEEALIIPENYKFVMFASDAEGTIEYTPTALTETNTIYVVLQSQGGVREVELVYNGEAETNADFVISQATAGSSKFETLTEGAASGSGIGLEKLVQGTDYIETVQFDAVKAAKVELLGGTTSSSNTQIFKVEALNAAGEVVASVYSAPSMAGKVLGYMLDAEGNKYVEITSEVEFVKIRISATGDKETLGDGKMANKNFCPAVVKVSYEVVVLPTIDVELVYNGEAETNADFVISQATAGSSKFETLTEGAASGSGIGLEKLVQGTDYIETVQFDAVKAAKVELLGGTTSSSNTQIFKVEALNAAGEVVATVYSAPSMAGKVLGYMLDAEGNKYVEITSEVEFVKIRISATGDKETLGDGKMAGKNFCPAVVKISYEVVVQPTVDVELVYNGEAETNANFFISQATAGSSKFETLTEGAASGSGIGLEKLVQGTDYIETVQFDAVKAAKVELLGGTTSSSNTQIFKVEALNAAGEVVATVYSAPSMAGKVLGYMLDAEGNKYVEITSDVEFVKIRISATGDKETLGDGKMAGKNFCPAVVKVTYSK